MAHFLSALPALIVAVLLGAYATDASTQQGFAALVTPPRFELRLSAGRTTRQIVEIAHVGAESGQYRIYTNDWVLGEQDDTPRFSDALVAGSCRPWVAIERRELQLDSGERHRYRFEITPPADAPAGECRFALMVEGLERARVEGQSIDFPVGGRIGVIVYAAIGDAAPKLGMTGTHVVQLHGQPTPAIDVHNSGNAHGRLLGFVDGVDADGAHFELAPLDVPILPGQTRRIALVPLATPGRPAPVPRFPLMVKGALEWGDQELAIDMRFPP